MSLAIVGGQRAGRSRQQKERVIGDERICRGASISPARDQPEDVEVEALGEPEIANGAPDEIGVGDRRLGDEQLVEPSHDVRETAVAGNPSRDLAAEELAELYDLMTAGALQHLNRRFPG